MIDVSVQLVPLGSWRDARTIHTIRIANDSSGDLETGNYLISVHSDQGDPLFFRVAGHDRSRPIWDILSLVIQHLSADRPDQIKLLPLSKEEAAGFIEEAKKRRESDA